MDETLAKLNNRITKTFKNPNITFFIIMVLILFISCYTFISEPIKNTISYIVSNPIMIVIIIAAILFIAQFNMIIALLSLVLLFISLYSFGAGNNLYSSPQIERFTSNQDSDNPDDDSDEPDLDGIIELPTKRESTSRLEKNLNIKKANDDEMDSKVRSIKDTILGTINKYRENNDDDYKRAILENKRKMYQSERNRNSNKNNSGNGNDNGSGNGKEKFGNTSGGSRKLDKAGNSKGKERFQTIEPRKFDPSNEEDTNLLITKEILEDMNNRIQYNYENNKYLKKYIKHRVEEIIDVNKLTED